MGRGWAKAGVSGGLGCARPGHVRPTGGQSSERVGAPDAHQQAMNPSRTRPRFLRIERARAREPIEPERAIEWREAKKETKR